MVILLVVSHTIIKDPYGTYPTFSKNKKIKKKKKNWILFLGAHKFTKTQLDSPLGMSQFFVKTKATYSERCSAKAAFLRSIKSLKAM